MIRIAVSKHSVVDDCVSVGDPMETDADVNIELIQRGLRVVVPQAAEKDAANVLQRAQEYMNGIKLMNEAIVDNITDRNKKILKKLTKKG